MNFSPIEFNGIGFGTSQIQNIVTSSAELLSNQTGSYSSNTTNKEAATQVSFGFSFGFLIPFYFRRDME